MKKKVSFWIGGVSAIITILLALMPLLSNDVDLDAYISGGEYIISPEDLGLNDGGNYPEVSNSKDNIYKLTIHNDGDVSAEDLTLMIPYPTYTYGVIIDANNNATFHKSLTSIQIGTLKPSKEIVVYIWSIHDMYPNTFSSSNIVISHSKGTAVLKAAVDGKGMLGFIDRYMLWFYLGIIMFISLFPTYIFNLGVKQGKAVGSENLACEDDEYFDDDYYGVDEANNKLALIKQAKEDGILSNLEYQARGKIIINNILGDIDGDNT